LQHSSPLPSPSRPPVPWIIVLYCLVSPQTLACLSACLVHAHAAVLRSSCRRPMQLQMHCTSFGRSKHPQSAPRLFNGAAQRGSRGGAAPGPPAPQRIWMHLDIELDIECRAAASDEPARAWPPGATWLYWLARASSLSWPRLSPVSPSQPQSAHEWAHPMPPASRTEGFSLLPGPPPSYYHRPARPLKIGGVPLVAIAIAIPLDIRPVTPMGVTNSLRRQPFLLVPLRPRSTPTPTSSP
jgi:hypothetical protein